ncbi:hypothetical protein DENIS_0127 [Desulfonema ishimotonii]|uniref:Uncharacterized protein n=1 Tax=Desulfonema ishimotonii TaxID=45657 RepID=A0A401FQD7_9BACT|nr:hypothetical protein [Desulfonema ishimotonii]GBC59191.1 hypothetical protein DENIS_0127 [Desulfonema ishimotonii]
MNPYFKNAKTLLRIAEKNISNSMSYEDLIYSSLFFGIGIESLLKGVIYDVNPIFIYIDESFHNIVPVLYKNKIKQRDNNIDKKKLKSNPDKNVLSYTESLNRAAFLSETTYENKQTIFRLKDVRDTIAHCLLSDLDEERLKNIVSQFKILVAKYENELDMKFIEAVVNQEDLEKYKLELTTKLQEKMKKHKNIWENNKGDKSYVLKARTNTITMDSACFEADNSYLITCPACSQKAVLFIFEEYGMNDYAETVVENIFVKNLSCSFCKLHIKDTEEIDYLKLSEAERVVIDWDR